MKTFASLFTGFGGADLGAMAAGLQPAWGVEYDAAIAEVGNTNLGQHIKVANILDCKPRNFERVDVLHASPPCPNFSVAKAGGVETAHDLAMAAKVAEFVTVLQPRVFTLENVQAYRKSRSWHIINEALNNAGYWLNIEIVNSADYGVPQTRKRMIVRAIRGGFVPYLPAPVSWVGWYAAIEDMLHTLPDSQFAPWQLARLPDELRSHWMIGSENAGQQWGGTRYAEQPSFTITTSQSPRAFLVGKHYDAPSSVLDRHVQTKAAHEPAMTVTSSDKNECRGLFDGGRVVAMTPRALARFQSFPDSYMLPDSKTLAAKGIGNAVPPLLMQRVMEGLL